MGEEEYFPSQGATGNGLLVIANSASYTRRLRQNTTNGGFGGLRARTRRSLRDAGLRGPDPGATD